MYFVFLTFCFFFFQEQDSEMMNGGNDMKVGYLTF